MQNLIDNLWRGMKPMASGEVPDWLYALQHPIKSARAKTRQIEVAIEHAHPPAGSTIEEFPELSLQEAVQALQSKEQDGICWPEKDLELMRQGKLPRPGISPEHNNV